MLQIIFVLWSISVAGANFYKTNETDLSKCKVHYSRTGSVYKDFYTITSPPGKNSSLQMDFHFSVLAPSDAHILLAPSEDVTKDDPVYEIVIGAGGNTFSDIRRQQKSQVKQSVRVKGLLSALDLKSFWLHISKDGIIEVGEECNELPFITWTDPDPLPLKVLSFSTWPGIEAKWFFDCPREDNSTQISERKKNLTHVEKLRKDLLTNYDPYVRPVMKADTITTIYMTLTTKSFGLDERRSIMDINGDGTLMWQDEKLKWNASEYGGIKYIHIYRREIWQPDLVLYNAVGDGRDILQDSMMMVHSNGIVQWKPRVHMRSWCSVSDMGLWPRDEHSCGLMLGFWADIISLRLEFDTNQSTVNYHELSEWDVLSVDLFRTGGNDSDTVYIDLVEIVFSIRRSSNVYNAIFFTPFLVVSASLLSTFWVTPFSHLKMSLGSLQLVVSTAMLLGLGIFIPSHSSKVPYLVLLYSYSLVASLVSIIVAIIVINLSRNQRTSPMSHYLARILTSRAMKIVLCLPETKMADEYGSLSSFPSKSDENQQTLWILLGVAIDRISFLIYLPLTIYAIYIH